ncbi:hypothetical protein J8273_1721 [Carpediemonas membranifera]|uniref:Uncharacterized protein n=1 Tax=Carpediemonas membranifera TaxID=201153 RepID=A0A8J6AXP4_9EUKA|nr:hypothetical protein J8273_1721 [Carpediemonas membranifera]|eukprot:KAG9396703.1 hypothetical protein J8273_1721 [Carpediemonas membranifera]
MQYQNTQQQYQMRGYSQQYMSQQYAHGHLEPFQYFKTQGRTDDERLDDDILRELMVACGEDLPQDTTKHAVGVALHDFVVEKTRQAQAMATLAGNSTISAEDLFTTVGDEPVYVEPARFILSCRTKQAR